MDKRIGIFFAVLGLAFLLAVAIELRGCNSAEYREQHADCDHHDHFQSVVAPSVWFAR